MWSPSYYAEWHRRVSETSLLNHDQRIAYAREHGVAYVVDWCGQAGRVVFGVKRRCIYAAN